ncbi:MAG: PQQ-binding-like beta-propeller repeat protein, partial [Candidatus Omnitrophica bacterium]|nr:PQQ-binding-like beta-propeller repeat protein [Candidatus Omnitrophota bacterium]
PVQTRVEDKAPKTQHEVVIDGFENQKMYYYRIEFADSEGKVHSTRLHELDTTFDFAPVETHFNGEAYPESEETQKFAAAAQEILDRAGIDRGYCVLLGVGEGRLAYELAKRSDLEILCLDPDEAKVQDARRRLDKAGLYGVRVSVQQHEGDSLPLAPFLANIVTSENLIRGEAVPYSPQDVLKILRPNGGIAILPKDWSQSPLIKDAPDLLVTTESEWMVGERKPLEGAGAWTHQYGDAGNTSSSHDRLLGGPLEVLWYGEPGPRPMTDRGTRSPAPLSINGRLFVQGDRRLFGLDAYNGTILWEREIPDLRRANVPRDCSNKMARGDQLFVAIRDRLWKVDGQTGKLLTTYPVTRPDNGFDYDWGYIADGGTHVLGSAVRHGGLYIGADGEWYDKPNQESEKVTSDNLFAIDPESGEVAWVYEKGRIINPTIAAGDGSVYFIESRSPEATEFRSARLGNDKIFKDQYMVALDEQTGKVIWERPVEFEGGNWVLYLSYYDGVISVLATTRQFHLHTFDAKDGTPIWEHHSEMRRDHHGGGMQHPVVTRGNIYSDSLAFDLHSGKVVNDDLPERRGCGTMSAAENAIFFRHHFHSIWDLDTDERIQYEGLRSGCWLGIVPAGGILLAPESSAGCYCADPIQTSIAFLPGGMVSEN